MLIKDLLTIDLSEDIKNVIDVEDISEAAIQSEIESYIITNGLAREYEKFVSVYTSNILETGVWLSGFYGSGKSYFGKLLGYMMSNRLIGGTPARDRILQRFTGVDDEALIRNSIAKLDSIHSRVVFLDIAKQNTSKGLAYALFSNFLKSLELPENSHGFLLFSLMCNAACSNVNDFVQDKLGKSWNEVKMSVIKYSKIIKELYLQLDNSEADYNNILTTIDREIDAFSATTLKEQLHNYFTVVKDEKVVFLFDETSEAIKNKKFTLLDLEGVSESLSALGGKVWTIAIAQEKLDDVINDANVNIAQLTKVTDRFRTKIHLEATEVDVIIRSRLLKKNDAAIQKLKEHYQQNSGKIADHSGLAGASTTDTADSYTTYYPFYKSQFSLLQNFLFGRQGYASTKVAARGMIITTYDILKHELQKEELYNVATGWQIAKEAQTQPDVRLVNRFNDAATILQDNHIDLDGRHLLETIHFLAEAEVTPTSLRNIVKSYIKSPEEYSSTEARITKALEVLVEHKIVLFSNGTYRISSDIEQRLLDEMMKQYSVQLFRKKQHIITAYRNAAFIRALARVTDNNTPYDFYITSDNDDELTNPGLKHLKLKVKSLYSYGDDRSAHIAQIRTQYQNDKDVMWLAPDNSHFREIDRLLEEIERIKYLEEKYPNPNSEEGRIVQAFKAERAVKENRLKELVEQSLVEGSSIYLYHTAQLDTTNWQTTLNNVQRQIIQNVYSQRLSAQLSDTIAERIMKEADKQRLHTFFTAQPAEFQFFDAQGNFVGESLKPAEQILLKIRNTFVDGDTLANDLQQPPTGFGFGTVITTVAALMRGGKIMARHNGSEKFSWNDAGVSAIFSAAREFRRASFKAIARSLSTAQKGDIVNSLQDPCEKHISKKIDWNTNDFEMVNAIRELAKRFCDKVEDMKRQNKDFDALFSNLENCKAQLAEFTGAVSEANYIEKAEHYLEQTAVYTDAVHEIEKAENFIRNNLDKIRQWKMFATSVTDELTKAAQTNASTTALLATFNDLYKGDVVKNFKSLQETVQKIKDAYFHLMQAAATEMAAKYDILRTDANAVLKEIAALPAGLNDEANAKTQNILQYASQRTTASVDIDYDVKDKHTRFTYSEMLSFIQLSNSYKTELEIIRAGFITTAPPQPLPGEPAAKPAKKTYHSTLPGTKISVSEYKTWLRQELQKLASAADSDEIEINK